MKKHIHILIVFGILMFGLGTSALAQEGEGGEIENVEIEIVKERQITMPKASRNFEKIPPRPAEPLAPAMQYDFRSLRFTAPDYSPLVKPLRLKDETLSKIYGNYVSAGFGNYNAPFLRGSISSKRNAEKYYGVDFFHHSFGKGPVDDKNSGSGYSKLNGYFSGMGPKLTADLGLNYENIYNHFYGYKPGPVEVKAEDIRQTYNIIALNAGFSNTKVSDFNFRLSSDFSYLNDRFSAEESEVGLHFNSRYEISKNQSLAIKGDYFLIARKDVLIEARPRHLFKVLPSYQFIVADKFRLSLGANVAVENDSSTRSQSFHLYPDAWARYNLTKSIEAYAGYSGDVDKVSLQTLVRENQWVGPNISIRHTNRSADFQFGVQGKVLRKVSFHAGASVANLKDLYYFENTPADRSKFRVRYDNVIRTNFFGEIGFTHSDNINLNFRADYFEYKADREAFAWQRPTFRVAAYSSFKIIDKVLLTVNLVSQGGAKAYDYETSRVVTLKSALNLDAKVRYFISKPLSVFLEGNNILNSKYPVYQFYQVRGTQVSAGVSWSF